MHRNSCSMTVSTRHRVLAPHQMCSFHTIAGCPCILRKGSHGYPKDLSKAFKLYSECGLPYAHYRCGEFYEYGWGTEKDLEKAKTYYTLAYKEGHGLARKKLKEWNFLE